MRRLARVAAAAAALALPLLPAAPADAYEYGCSGSYAAVGSASQVCYFVYTGGSITIRVTADGPLGLKYATIGLYPYNSWSAYETCEDYVENGYTASCSETVTPSASIGDILTCSSGAAVRPYGTVTYSCR